MKTRAFGRTGLETSEVALGGGRVGGILIDPEEPVRAEALQRAVKAGIRWIDTAAQYGDGQSESTIGRHIASLSPRPNISTKFHVRPEDAADVYGAVRRSLERSLARLGLDRVEAFQLHNHLAAKTSGRMISAEDVLRKGGVADAVERLKAEGLIRSAGLTAAGEMPECLKVIESGRFDSAQVYYNLLNPSAAWSSVPAGWSAQDFSGLIGACKRHGMGMLNIRVYAGGSLASPKRHGREFVMAAGSDLDSEERRAAAVRAVLGDVYGTPAQTALRFCLAQPDLSCCVVGLAGLDQLDEAIAGAALGPLPAEAIARLQPLWARDSAFVA